MAKKRKATTAARKPTKKVAKKSAKTRAKKGAAGQKRKSQRTASQGEPRFIDNFLKIFAPPETRKT